jgi:hypothetical protein
MKALIAVGVQSLRIISAMVPVTEGTFAPSIQTVPVTGARLGVRLSSPGRCWIFLLQSEAARLAPSGGSTFLTQRGVPRLRRVAESKVQVPVSRQIQVKLLSYRANCVHLWPHGEGSSCPCSISEDMVRSLPDSTWGYVEWRPRSCLESQRLGARNPAGAARRSK